MNPTRKPRQARPLCDPEFLQIPDSRTPSENNTHSGKTLPTIDTLSPKSAKDYVLRPASHIHSATPPQEYYAQMLKNFPPQNNWALYEALVERWGQSTAERELAREERRTSDLQLLVWGVAGTGKTSTIDTVAELIYGEKPDYFNAGGRALNDLLIETRLTREQENIPRQIENAFDKKKLNLNSLSLLREKAPRAFQKDANGKEFLDLGDPNRFPLTEENRQTLTAIAHLEGLLNQGSSLGVHYVEGPLIRAAKTGKVLVVDEVDKCLEGGSDKLSQVMLALNGQLDAFTFEENGISFTFQRRGAKKTVHPDFDIIYTANDMSNGTSSQWAGQHLLQRVQPFYIKPNGTSEIATRIEQTLLGFNPLPLEISQNIKNKRDAAEAIFRESGQPLTDLQLRILDKLPKLRQAAQQLACMFAAWHDITNANSGEDEILEASRNVVAKDISVRYAQQVIIEALAYTDTLPLDPKDTSPAELNDVDDALALIRRTIHNTPKPKVREIGLGEKIQVIVQKRLSQFACSSPTLQQLTSAARLHGVIPPEESEESNANAQKVELIKDLLNTLEDEIRIEPQTYELRDAYCELLKKRCSELQNTENEKIIPAKTLQNHLDQSKKLSDKNQTTTYTVGLNPTYLQEKSGSPIALVPLLDQNYDQKELQKTKKEALAQGHPNLAAFLSDCEEIEASLKNPTIRKNCIRNLWSLAQRLQLETENKAKDPNWTMSEYSLDSIIRGNPLLQAGRILGSKTNSKKPKEKAYSPVIVLQSEEKGLFVAYSKDFKNNYQSGHTAITNDAKAAAKTLLAAMKTKEDQLYARRACLYLKTPHTERDWNEKEGYYELDPKEKAERQKALTDEDPPKTPGELQKEIEENLQESWALHFNRAINPAKFFVNRKTPQKTHPEATPEIPA
jgi:hypothetical protein